MSAAAWIPVVIDKTPLSPVGNEVARDSSGLGIQMLLLRMARYFHS